MSVYNRRLLVILSVSMLTMGTMVSSTSYADTTWSDYFIKPLLTNVLIPSVSTVTQKIINHGKAKPGTVAGVPGIATPGVPGMPGMPGMPSVAGATGFVNVPATGATPVAGEAAGAMAAVGAMAAGVGAAPMATTSTMATIVASTPEPTPEAPISAQYTAAAPPPPPVATP